MRKALTTLAEVVGIATVATGCWLLLPAVGIIAAGVGLIVIGVALA